MIKRSIPWARQPQTPVEVDRASPFYKGLTNLVAVINGRPIQLVGTNMTLNGTLTSKAGINGVSITNNGEKVSSGTVSNYISLPVLTSECSVLVYGSRYTTPPASNVATLSCTRSSAEAAGISIDYGNAFGDANALYLSTFGAASGIDCYADGVPLTGNNPTNKVVTTGTPICFVGAITSHTVGSGHTVLAKAAGTSDYTYDVGFVLYGTWNRKLSAAESIKLTTNPWQLLVPQQRNIYVSVAGGTSVSVDVTGLTGTTALGDETVTAIQNVSTSVTGLQGTTALGTVSVTAIQNVSTSVTGLTGTTALGSVTVDVGGSTSVSVTGLTGTSALGTVSVTAVQNISTSVTGLLGTSALGTVTVTTGSGADVLVNVTGLTATASLGSVLVWGLVDTAQTPNWSAISTTQTPNWTRIAT